MQRAIWDYGWIIPMSFPASELRSSAQDVVAWK